MDDVEFLKTLRKAHDVSGAFEELAERLTPPQVVGEDEIVEKIKDWACGR